MKNIADSTRFAILLAALLLAPSTALFQPAPDYKYSPPAKLNDGINTGTLRSAKIDEAKIEAGTNEILKGTFPNIHSLLIFRHGKLVYENYFKGEDVERGVGPLGIVEHSRDTLHDMRSVTKSVVAAAVLIARAQGKIRSMDDPIFDYFPEYSKYAEGDKKNITIKHVLSMTAGLEWDEKISYADPKNSEIQMNTALDAIDFILKQKLVDKPGTVFNYSGGCSQLLVALIKKTTGMEADLFTEKHLFAPLGIAKYKWVKTKSGDPSAASGLRLRSRDMAKIGLLLMNRGQWNGKRIIPARLADEATKVYARVDAPEGNEPGLEITYGFQIWQPSFPFEGEQISLQEFNGNGGQTVQIDRKYGILVAVTAGNYNVRVTKNASVDIYSEIILPALLDRKRARSADSR
ncbi:MAG TPA: serine hydrolase [Pyrinomonadaceae bacterium]|nr:serine hydrolase [Pyrinomonadaceae bacterium]